MRPTTMFLALLLVPSLAGAQQPTYGLTQPIRPYVPRDGFVPDSAAAVRVAIAIWTTIYGDGQLMTQHTVTATLNDGTWTVTGTVLSRHAFNPGRNFTMNGQAIEPLSGDMAVIKISKRDGRILYQGHT